MIIAEAEFFAVHEKTDRKIKRLRRDLRFRALPGGLIRAVEYIRRSVNAQTRRRDADAIRELPRHGYSLHLRSAPKISEDKSTRFFQRPNVTAVFNVTGNPAISICHRI